MVESRVSKGPIAEHGTIDTKMFGRIENVAPNCPCFRGLSVNPQSHSDLTKASDSDSRQLRATRTRLENVL